ncbi:MAG: LacI family DNA-binding transcriptional regulator [Thermoanaerobacteraceae bacterium]|nr:LacI family DNA-binding transcriptional regulator [Thermoanaerobacteraceae bacterium]
MATIKDVARKANVSITTVSRVINNKTEGVSEETRERILKVMQDLNYQPNRIARGLVTKRTNTLGLILPDIANPFFPEIARGVEDTANIYGYNVILCNTDDRTDKEELYINVLKEKCVDGIVFTSSVNPVSEHIKQLMDYKMPFVLLDRYMDIDHLPGVYSDGYDGMYQITRYLFEMGHRDIAYIGGPSLSATAKHRYEGFEYALREYGVGLDDVLIEEGNYKISGGKEAMARLVEKGMDFTAVACANDLMAVGAMEVLKDKGYRIPEDVSVTGFDDIQLSGLIEPKLTTVAQPCYEMGAVATRMLIKLIEGQALEEQEIKLKPRLVIRNSVKRVI